MVGIAGDEPLTLEGVLAVVHPEHRDMVRQHVHSYTPETGRRELEFKIARPDGEVRWLLDRGQGVPDKRTSGVRVMGTILDITDRKRNEERQSLLMAELDHRVKNILSNVSAVARLSSHRAQSVAAFVDSLDGRIQAISRAHGLLRRGAWAGASLTELASDALAPFQSSGNIRIDGPPVSIVPEVAQSMALILHELATNAVKHGALSTPSGRVKLSWSRPSTGQLRFVWQESGGPRTAPPATKGFGLTVLQTAASDLGAVANYHFGDQGFLYTLQGPFEHAQPMAVVFPFSRPAEVPAPIEKSPAVSRVLVVEDEALVALQLQHDLEQAGHHIVGPARSLKHGLMLASQEHIDAALLDVSLGRETSAAIADQLIARNIPFAFATGYSDSSLLPEHLRETPRLSKPYVVTELRQIVDALIGDRGKRQKANVYSSNEAKNP